MSSITYKVIASDLCTEWYHDGKLHRIDGPAREFVDGTRFWYLHGQKHREDGPAEVFSSGNRYWYFEDRLHRIDGPAIERNDGKKYWYLNGIQITEEEHQIRTKSEHQCIHTGKKLINWFDPISVTWREGYFLTYTSNGDTVIETVEGYCVQLPNGTAKIKDIEKNEY